MEFEKIYTFYWQKVFRICMGYTNDSDWAKDITQDIFIIILEQLPKFRNESGIGTWIFRIATNNCLRQLQKSKRMLQSEIKTEFEDKIIPNLDSKINFLYQCISELPEIERIIISLELEEIKQAEIAIIVGLSESNIRVKIHRIKDKLTTKFKKHEE